MIDKVPYAIRNVLFGVSQKADGYSQLNLPLGSRVVSVMDSSAEGLGSNRSRDAVG